MITIHFKREFNPWTAKDLARTMLKTVFNKGNQKKRCNKFIAMIILYMNLKSEVIAVTYFFQADIVLNHFYFFFYGHQRSLAVTDHIFYHRRKFQNKLWCLGRLVQCKGVNVI